MTPPERFQLIENLYHAALEKAGSVRSKFLRQACAGDAGLLREVESLLAVRTSAEGFLEGRAMGAGARLFANNERSAAKEEPTGASVSELPMAGSSDATGTMGVSSASTPSEGRLAPGTLIAARYRILALAGQGGMGEVYRAYDATLDQVVALKFLPENLRSSPGALSRLRNEVRIARQVSHPNVCRVYDVGDAGDLHFITMEFVEGENLMHLLKRIGRFPSDKGVEITRRLCAAAAAAHSCGVLHRDLKPSNIMLNEAGQIVVTDFGLAAIAGHVCGAELASGTPAYMAPEQLAGREVTTRSDIYALGLVMYEIFTGKGAFMGRDRKHFSPPSELVKDLDPSVERVILRCLAENPAERFPSAMAVASALPGGDPLQAAMDAGETPSPEMVAASGEEFGISVRAAVLWFAAVLALLGAAVVIRIPISLNGNILPELSPDAFVSKGREIATSLGYPQRPHDVAYGFEIDTTYLGQLSTKNDWMELADRRPTPAYFWYRESPWVLGPVGPDTVLPDDPPLSLPGMISLQLDSRGRLTYFQAVPPVRQQTVRTGDVDWKALFAFAGLDMSRFEPVSPEWLPLVSTDVRKAWKGTYPGQPNSKLRIEAASQGGKIVYFRAIDPWVTTAPGQTPTLANPFNAAFSLTVYLGVCWLAWQNWRRGRGDRRAAYRFGVFMCVVRLIYLVTKGQFDHYFSLARRYEWKLFGDALFFGCLAWAAYMALEPLIRRKWPQSLVSWSRLLAGQIHDPLVGRDILVGIGTACAAIVLKLIVALSLHLVSGRFIPENGVLPSGILDYVAELVSLVNWVGIWSLLQVVLFVILWMVLRSKWLGAVAMAFLASAFWASGFAPSDFVWLWWILSLAISLINVVALLRFGVTTFLVAFTTETMLMWFPPGLDFAVWFEGFGRVSAALVLIVTFYGFRTALGGRRVLNGNLLV